MATSDVRDLLERKRHAARRQRILLGLVAAAAISLIFAILRGSGLWLAISIGFDLVIGGYVAVLLHIQQSARPSASVVPLRVVEEDPHAASVRVVAG